MKRVLTVLFTALLLTAALCVTASAATFESAAQELSGIGMFRGTASGFELDRAPTRSEAAIMLTRLYGAEDAAQAAYEAGEIRHPFTDVSDFVSPYVAWLYNKGLTKGVSDTAFGSAQPCSARSYTVFLLRALGYQDGVDFQYADAQAFAAEKGMMDLSSLMEVTFLRDDLAGMTYQALACDMKDGGTYLLDSLVKSGAVDAEAAKPITEKIETYRALTASSQENSLDVDFTMKMNMKMAMNGSVMGQSVSETEEASLSAGGKVQVILDDDWQMSMDFTGTVEGEEPQILNMWMRDGWIYIKTDDETLKIDISEEMSEIIPIYQAVMESMDPHASVAMGLPLIDSITSAASGRDTVYTLTMGSAITGFMDRIIDLAMAEAGAEAGADLDVDMDLDVDNLTYTYTVGSDGKLKAVNAKMAMALSFGGADEDDSIAVSVSIDADIDMKVNAVGDSVKISYPADLDKYPEAIGGADGPTSIVTAA